MISITFWPLFIRGFGTLASFSKKSSRADFWAAARLLVEQDELSRRAFARNLVQRARELEGTAVD
jgi:hypothetical protein